MKIWSVKSLPAKKRLDILPPQQFYITSHTPAQNAESLTLPSKCLTPPPFLQ